MPAALVGAATCGRCAERLGTTSDCPRCGATFVPAADAAVTLTTGPLTGAVRAGLLRRWSAHALDLALLVGVFAGLWWLTEPLSTRSRWILSLSGAGGILIAQTYVLLVHGRSVGRLLLSLRTVDDLSGTPVRLGRFGRQLGASGRLRRLLTADLRRGRDPVQPQIERPTLGVDRHRDVDTVTSARLPLRPQANSPYNLTPAVSIRLDTGERHDIERAVLVGRSPSDPGGHGDRTLLAWPDLSRRLAKTHLLLEWLTSVLWVTDLNSATGTAIVDPTGRRMPLVPGVRQAVAIGSVIEAGGRRIEVVPRG